jgi:prolyl oligopeptidase
MDMLRYHTLRQAQAGHTGLWNKAQDSRRNQFEHIEGHSVHNALEHHPATMVTNGDHDDREKPAHSFNLRRSYRKTKQEKMSGVNSH